VRKIKRCRSKYKALSRMRRRRGGGREGGEDDEKEEEEENIRYTVVIMFILFTSSITLMCYFSTYIHRLRC
jgi:hypothetical protein